MQNVIALGTRAGTSRNEAIQTRSRAFLGIDYGRKRIGLAISELGIIAKPLKTIENKGTRKNLITFTEIVKRNNIGTIVIGLPVHKNTTMSDEVQVFAKTLETLNLEIIFQNEMLTSVEAETVIARNEAIPNGPTHHKSIDSIAASMILQEYLTEKGRKLKNVQN